MFFLMASPIDAVPDDDANLDACWLLLLILLNAMHDVLVDGYPIDA